MARKIIIFSTVNARKTELTDVEATTFGDVQEALSDKGVDYDYNKLQAIEKSTRTILRTDSTLPEGDITIFLAASNSDKAAELKYRELRMFIQENKSNEDFKKVLDKFEKKFGKNYTQFTTVQLNELYSKYVEKNKKSTVVKPSKKVNKNSIKDVFANLETRIIALENALKTIGHPEVEVNTEDDEIKSLQEEAASIGL